MWWWVCAVMGVVMAVSAAWGEPGEAEQEQPVYEVEVVGERDTSPPGQQAASVSVVTETEIARSGAENLMDLLVREAGVWVSRQGGMGYGGNVTIRGFGGSPPTQLVVLLDGHPTQMGIMGHILPTSYILDNVKRIEVLRGPAGVVYGDMSIGGVINIITRGPKDEEANGEVSATAGSFDTFGGQLWWRELGEHSGYRAQIGRFSTDGDNPFAKYDGDNYSLAADWDLPAGWQAAFRGQRLIYTTFDQREVANAYAAGRPARFTQQRYDRQDYDLTFRTGEGARRTEIKLYRTEGAHQFEDGFHSEDYGHGFMFTQAAPVGRGRGQWGLSWRATGGDIYSMKRIFSRKERGAYLVLEQEVADTTQLSAGLRYTSPSDLDSEVLPHFGLTHQLPSGWTLFASARRGYRLPSFRELFLFGINNPALQPESAWQYEVGARRLLPSGAQLELTAFRIDADDLIVLRPRPAGLPGPPVQWTNAPESVRREGLEIGARWPAGRNTALYANFSCLDPGEVKEQTVGRKFCAGADYRAGEWLWSGDVEYVDRLFDYDQTRTLVEVPAFTVVNLKTSRSAGARRFSLVVENLFDRTYRVDPAYPYPMPGRTVRFQIEQEW